MPDSDLFDDPADEIAPGGTQEEENPALATLRVVDQRFVADFPVRDMRPHPRNPNQGDVGAIYESIQHNGFYGVVGVHSSTGHILWGNHRYEAALQAGAAALPALVVDCDDDAALRILLVDNRAAKLSTTDDNLLVDILHELAASPEALRGTAYTAEDFDAIIASLGQSVNFDDLDPTADAAAYPYIDVTLRLPRARLTDTLERDLRAVADANDARVIIKAMR